MTPGWREQPSRRYGLTPRLKEASPMRLRFLAVFAALAVAGAGVAQMKPEPQNPVRIEYNKAEEAAKAAPRISREEAQKLVSAGKAVFVDVRTERTYEVAHIKGAL